MTLFDLSARIGLSLLFGLLVGMERQWHHKNAGVKTFTLVSVGSAAFAVTAELGFGAWNNVPTQLAAGVASGIGFIGAGVILRRAGNVQGINTAATLWATTSMGLAIGAGHYRIGTCVVIAILLIQFPLGWLAKAIDKRSGFVTPLVTYHLSVAFKEQAAEAVRSGWFAFSSRAGVCVEKFSETRSDSDECLFEASFRLSELRASEMNELGRQFATLDGVVSSEWNLTSEKES